MRADRLRCSEFLSEVLFVSEYGISFELDEPIGINKSRDLHNRVRWSNLAKELAMDFCDRLPILDAHQKGAGANHVPQRGVSLLQGASNYFEAPPGLRSGVSDAHGTPVWAKWSGAGN